MQTIRGKMTSLGVTYAGSEHSCKRGWDVDFVYKVMLEVGVSVRTLFFIYDKMFKAKVGHC